jgi:hypothetical protein
MELHNFFPSPNTIKAIIYKRKWWSGDPVTNIVRREMRTEFWRGNEKEISLTEDMGVAGMIILKCVLKKKDGLNWINLTQDRYVVFLTNMIMNVWCP